MSDYYYDLADDWLTENMWSWEYKKDYQPLSTFLEERDRKVGDAKIEECALVADGISQYPDSRESVEYKNGYYAAGRSIVNSIRALKDRE